MAVRETICPIASGIARQYSRPITPPPSPRVTPDVPSELSWLLSKYAIGERIGHGAFADVYSGSRRSDRVKIAVKYMVLREEVSRIAFEREVAAMQSLRHPGCLNLLFVEKRHDDAALILPLMQGSLLGGLNRERAGAPFPEWQTTKMKCIIGVAFIMEYLHSLNWMHRDVKPENVLLDDSFDPVLADFGTARRLDQPDSVGLVTMLGTPFHMAPEMTSDDGYGKPDDVFSYAVLLYRVFTDKVDLDDGNGPYKGVKNFIRRVSRGARYPAAPEIPAAYWQLITWCWDQNPSGRPTFTTIVDYLVTYLSSFMLPQSNESQVASYVNKMRQYRP
jgi:serine/threonine protein kinase